MAEETVGSISQYMWDIAVLRIGQLASEMNVSMGGQSVGGSWKSRACLTPEGKAMLTPENFFILTPLKS